MASTNINIRMDSDLKKQFEAFCSDMGMTMTTAFNIFAKKRFGNIGFPLKSVRKSRMMKQKRQFGKYRK